MNCIDHMQKTMCLNAFANPEMRGIHQPANILNTPFYPPSRLNVIR